MKKLYELVTQILFNPKAAVISLKSEEISIEKIFREYLLILCVIPAVATFLGWWGSYQFSFGKSFLISLIFYFFIVFGIWLTGYIASAVSPTFGGIKSPIDGLKISFIAWTPYLISSILNILPRISILTVFAVFYGIYLFYLASEEIVRIPKEKKTPFVLSIGVLMLLIWYIGRIIYSWGRV